MNSHLRRLVAALSAVAAVATFSALPAGAVSPTTVTPTVTFTQGAGSVTVTWSSGYGPVLGLYPSGTTCPTVAPGVIPAVPSFSKNLSVGATSPLTLDNTSMLLVGWYSNPEATVTPGTYSFCMYDANVIPPTFIETWTLVNTSAFEGTIGGSSPPPVPDTPSVPDRVSPSFTG